MADPAVDRAGVWRSSIGEGLAALAAHADPAQYLIRRGSMRVGLYAPRGSDDQTPHAQDELYIIARGEGVFVKGDSSVEFSVGDLFSVEAGVAHHFEDFTSDFVTWVFFWGPQGGDADALGASLT